MRNLAALLLLSVACCCAPTNETTAPPDSSTTGTDLDSWQEPQASSNDDSSWRESATTGRYATPPDALVESRQDRSPRPAAEKSAPTSGWQASPSAPEPSRNHGGPIYAEDNDAAGEAEESGDSWGKSHAPARKSAGGGTKSRARSAPSSASASRALAPRTKPKVDKRPGLGTTWGETRHSSVSEVPFQRDSSRPHYRASLHYNDARGAAALTNSGSRSYASIGLGGALTVSLRDEYGSTVSAYRGAGKTCAVGQHGQRYTLMVQNKTNERFEVILSVDGLDVIDGRDAGYNKRGYLIAPYGIIEVDGFRRSSDEVAAFRFGSVRNSYAAKTGSARNVGVIGAAAFGERGYSARLRAYRDRMVALRMQGVEVDRRRSADPFPNGYALPPLNMAR